MCKRQSDTLPYALLILLQSVLYGFGNPLSKIGFESITVLWCLGIRFSGAAVVMLLLFGRHTLRSLRAAPLKAWLPCSLAMAAAYASCNLALQFTTATNVGFFMSLPVLFTPALMYLVLKRPYPKRVIPIQLAVIAGLYLLCCGGEGGRFTFGPGEVLGLVCALSLAAALVLSERAMPGIDPVSMATAQTTVTGALCLAAALLFDDTAALTRVTGTGWLVVAYLALLCTCLSYVLQNVALTRLSSYTVSLLQCTQPVLTAACSYLLLRERLTAVGITGAAIIVVCVVLENWQSGRKATA